MTGKARGFPALGPLPLRFCPFALGAILLAGCADLNRAVSTGIDPLLGGPPVKAVAPGAPQPATAITTLPPLPGPSTGISNAALAAGVSRPLDGGRDLRIGSAGSNSGNDGWGGLGSNRGTDNPGAVLRQPETAMDPAARRDFTTVSNPPATADSRTTTFEQAQAQLTRRGVIWQRLETAADNGEWRFSCSVPNPQNPRVRRTYEGRARDSLAAIQAVLEQIDKEK